MRSGTLGDAVEAYADRVRDYLRRPVRKNHSPMKIGQTHTPIIGQSPKGYPPEGCFPWTGCILVIAWKVRP